MNDVTSALSFRNYKVSKISFELNNDYKPEENNKMIDLDYSISSAKRIIDNNLIIQLSVKIFENMKEENKPFTMEVVMDGIFTVTNNNDNIDYEKMLSL